MAKVDLDVVTVEIAKLQLVGGDILVLRPHAMYPDALSNFDVHQLARMLPASVQLWCIPQDVDMAVISPPKEATDAS